MLSCYVAVHEYMIALLRTTQQYQLKPPMSLISRDANSSLIGLEKSLDAVFLVQGLEVVVPCQYHILTNYSGQTSVSRTTNMLLI
jgi:hypothetical protein